MPSEDAKARLHSGVTMMRMGVREQALQAFDEAIEIDPGYTDAHVNRGAALDELGRHEEALVAYDHAIRLDPNNFAAQYNRGNSLSKLGREHEALTAFDRAIQIRPDVSEAHFNLGAALHRLGWLDEALQAFEKAIELDPTDNDARQAMRTVLREIGLVTSVMSELRALARHPELTASRQGNEIEIPPGFEDFVEAQRIVDQMQQDPQPSEYLIPIYERILERWGLGEYPAFRATVLCNLGSVYAQLPADDHEANLRRAIACFREALSVFTPEYTPLDYATIQIDLGEAYRKLTTGDLGVNLAQAIACFREALRFVTPQNAPVHYAMAQNNLGNAYAGLPTDDRELNLVWAIACYREALSTYTQEEAPLKYARTLSNLGSVYQRRGELLQAIECFQEAVRYCTPETVPYEYAGIQLNLGNAYAELTTGDREENTQQAIECYQVALRFFTPETAPREYAGILSNLGNAYRFLPVKDPVQTREQAIEYYQEALSFYDPGIAPRECRRTGRILGSLLFSDERWSEAHTVYDVALRAAENLYESSFMESSRSTEIGENMALYAHDAFCLARIGHIPEGIMRLEAGKTRMLSERLDRDAFQLQQADPEDRAEYQRLTNLLKKSETQQRSSLVDSEQPVVSGRVYVETAKKVIQIQQDCRALIERIRQYAPDFLPTPLDFTSIQALLKDKQTALILPCVTERGSVNFVIRHKADPIVVWTEDFTQTDLRRLLLQASDQVKLWFELSEVAVRQEYPRAWNTALSEIADSQGQYQAGWLTAYQLLRMTDDKADHPAHKAAREAWLATIERVLAEVGVGLIAPLYAELQRHSLSRLILIPHGSLFLLPLHAAPISQSGACLLDRYEVSYAPSTKVLQRCQEQAACSRSQGLFAIGNPTGDLAFAGSEVSIIASYFGEAAVVLGSKDATKGKVLAQASGHGYVHFSCHGQYDWEEPYHRSALLLAGSLKKDEKGQSVVNYELALTLAEVEAKLDLAQTRLVTLSACETGLSEAMGPRAEEYIGLPAGFLLAGVPGVVSSLWRVPDLSTALLMERFYRNHLHGEMDFAAALRKAQRWMRDMEAGEVAEYAERCYRQADKKSEVGLLKHWKHYRYLAERAPTSRPFGHPHYWAAFTMNGV